MAAGPVRRLINCTLLSGLCWYRCGVATVTIAALAVLIKVTFGSSQVNEPMRPHIVGRFWSLNYGRGWSWEFHTWFRDAWAGAPINELKWNTSALIGDVIVFICLAGGIIYLGWRIARSPRWSLRWIAVALTIVCLAGGWLANAYQRSQHDRKLSCANWSIHIYPEDSYVDPLWFQRLTGEKGAANELFYRLAAHEVMYPPRVSANRERYIELLSRRRRLRELTFVGDWQSFDLSTLWRLPSLSGLRKVDFHEAAISTDALQGIEHCPQLREIDLSGTSISDEAIQHLSACTRLKVLRLSHTKITPASLPALEQMGTQATIDVRQTTVGDQQPRFRLPATTSD